MLNELRIAIRHYVRQPVFALTVVSTLALTVGATAAVFAVVNGVLVRALPFASPERLVWITSVRPDNPAAPFTLPEFIDYRSRARALSGLAAYANWSASLAGDDATERLQGARMSANAFDVLGISPAAGRLLTDSDDRADAPQVVVLSHRLWRRRFGAAVEAIGKPVRINGAPFVVVGVLPAQFPLPLRNIDVVTALAPDRDPLRHVRGSVNFLRLFGRVKASDAGEAQAELTAICRSLRQQFPVEYARKEAVKVVPLHEVLVGDYRQSMLVMLAAVVVVFGAALANLVSLALVRANGRHAELAVRSALGASRLQLVRQLVAEASLLAVAGSGLGWVFAIQATSLAVAGAPASIPRLGEVSLDSTVALVVAAITAIVTALLSITSLAAALRTVVGDALRAASRGAIGNRWNARVRNAMVVAEISVALVLLLVTLVLIQNLLRLQDLNPGFNPDGVFQTRVSIPPSSYRSPEAVSRFYERVLEQVSASPGVRKAGVISVAPLSGLLATVPFSVAGQASEAGDRASANLRVISPDYLSAVGSRLLQGRPFSENDRQDTPHVGLVSAALADRFLSGGAVGQRLLIDDNNVGPRPIDIVGVVENVRQAALDLPPAFDVYIPLRQIHPDGLALIRDNQFWMIKTDSSPAAFRETFLSRLRAVEPDAAVSDTGTMRMYLDAWLGPRRFNLGLFSAFALTALLLAVTGLYGLVSFTISQRAPEIGLRMALGATGRDVQGMILRQAARLGVSGAAGGLFLAGASWPAFATMVHDVSLTPAVVVATTIGLVSVVMLAAWLPARRAARIDPTLTLRAH